MWTTSKPRAHGTIIGAKGTVSAVVEVLEPKKSNSNTNVRNNADNDNEEIKNRNSTNGMPLIVTSEPEPEIITTGKLHLAFNVISRCMIMGHNFFFRRSYKYDARDLNGRESLSNILSSTSTTC